MVSGFRIASQKLAARRQGDMRNRGRRTLADSKARLREARAAQVINRAVRSFLNWLHRQPWYGIAADMRNPVVTEVCRVHGDAHVGWRSCVYAVWGWHDCHARMACAKRRVWAPMRNTLSPLPDPLRRRW
jgi:hypothetical protein